MLNKDDWELTLNEAKSMRNQLEIQKILNTAHIEAIETELKKFKNDKPTNSTDKAVPAV